MKEVSLVRAKSLHLILKQTAMLLHANDEHMQSIFSLLTLEEREEFINDLLDLNIECGRLLVKLGQAFRPPSQAANSGKFKQI